jgi:adenylyl-sulfate kinase
LNQFEWHSNLSLLLSAIQDERDRRHKGGGGGGGHDELVNERMPMCVGICVLLAIVYVLSRTGGDQAATILNKTPQSPNQPNAPSLNIVPEVMEPVDMTADNTLDNSAAAVVTPPAAPVADSHAFVRGADTPSNNVFPAPTTTTATTTTTPVATTDKASTVDQCAGLVDPANLDMGKVREAAFARTPPHIIECAKAKRGESQEACHLPAEERYAAVKQKGATLWMTGCSGAGKTTIATMLEDILVKQYGKQVYRLDGDNLRTGLNRDLTFTEADRAESVRRTGEIATLFADSGVITLVGLISPYRGDRDMVRKRHEDSGIPFYEVFLDVPVDELMKRDPKGQYAKVSKNDTLCYYCWRRKILLPDYRSVLHNIYFT